MTPCVTPRFYYDGSSLCRLNYSYFDPRLLSTVPSISELVVYANALFGHSWKSFMISGRRQLKIKKNRHFKRSFASPRLVSKTNRPFSRSFDILLNGVSWILNLNKISCGNLQEMFDARLYLLLPKFLSLCAKSYPRWILLDARRKMQNWCKIIPTILAHWTLEWPGWCEKVLDLLLEASSVLVHVQRPVHALIEVRMIKPLLITVKATFKFS